MSERNQDAFSKKTALAIILVGVFTFSAFIVLSAYAPKLREGKDGGTHALSESATGYAFLADLLKQSGMDVLSARGAVPNATSGVLVYTPPEFDSIAEAGPLDPDQYTVIVAPKWATTPDPFRRGWVRKLNVKPARDLTFTLGEDEEEYVLSFLRIPGVTKLSAAAGNIDGEEILAPLSSTAVGEIDRLQYFPQNDALDPVIVANGGQTLVAQLRGLPFYVVSDPDFLNTHGLADENRARLAAGFIDYLRFEGTVIFDLSLHGIERTRNVVRLMLEPPFLAATLCVLLATLLLAFKAAARFGPTRASARAFEAGKSALADNSAALIRMARRETAYGGRYAHLVRRRIAAALGAPKTASDREIDALIAKIAQDGQDFTALAERLGDADNAAYFVKTARRLYQFKKEIISEPR